MNRGGVPEHVLMTSDAVGGVWTYCMELCRAFSKQGTFVTLANLGPYATDAQIEEASAIPGLHVLQRALRLEWMDDPWEDVNAAGEWLLELECDLQPNVIHLNGYCHAALPWRTPTVVVGHSCVASWWHHVKREALPERYERYRMAVRKGLRAARLVVAPTAAMLQALREQYGGGFKGAVIPNGRDSHEFQRSEKEPFVFSCGRLWDEAKNISVLDSAASRLSWPVYVAGNTLHPNGERFKAVSVRTLGNLEARQIKDWYARAAIYAAPARYEPFGLSVLEAAMSGCALVLSNIATFRELWNGAALFIDPDNEEEWARALADAAECPALRKELADAAWRRAGTFSTDRMAESYLQAYESVLAEPGRKLACAS